MCHEYLLLREALKARGMHTYFQGEGQLVICCQEEPAWPGNGNSFWVMWSRGHWYLCTWIPKCYRLAETPDVIELCTEFVAYGREAQASVPIELIEKYGLTVVNEQEIRFEG